MASLQQVATGMKAQRPTVILGGGIIGLSTGSHLALASQNTLAPIIVADLSSTICGAASGQCEGALGEFGLGQKIAPLGKLSYRLYSELASRAATESIGYSALVVHTVFSSKYDPSNPRLPFPVQEPEALSKLPPWLKVQETWKGGLINDGSTAARLDPPKFCKFLQEECEKLGVEFLTHAETVQVNENADDDELEPSIDLRLQGGETRRVPCQNLVISAGSWSPKLFSRLFPSVDIGLRLAEKQHVQTWLRFSALGAVADLDEKEQEGGSTDLKAEACQQVWLSPLDEGDDIHVSSFADGECMWLARSNGSAATPHRHFPTTSELGVLPSFWPFSDNLPVQFTSRLRGWLTLTMHISM
ncbi:hypothetical protein OQA88_4625 [Cercophora sp. LCS_1]